ncbi:hypothetical protein HJ581_0045375 [Rhodococcus opacus]|nr:hypothetical protein HJ581_0045375 [Rhodococcus opacus]
MSAARNWVVSEATRETRSPTWRLRYSLIGNRTRCPINSVRAVSTTLSAVRCSR